MWRWETDVPVAEPPTFPTQADAEAWLTVTYPDLAAEGVTEVSLFQDDRLVYGPMSLAG